MKCFLFVLKNLMYKTDTHGQGQPAELFFCLRSYWGDFSTLAHMCLKLWFTCSKPNNFHLVTWSILWNINTVLIILILKLLISRKINWPITFECPCNTRLTCFSSPSITLPYVQQMHNWLQIGQEHIYVDDNVVIRFDNELGIFKIILSPA